VGGAPAGGPPGGAAPAGGDPLGVIAAGLGSGVALGLGVIGGSVLAADARRPAAADRGDAALFLAAGVLAGMVAAGAVAWVLLRPIGSDYRRGGLALVGAFATVPLMLAFVPLHLLLGRAGLAAAVAAFGLASILLMRRARRLAAA
jgi:hypothetical protein